MKEIGKLSAEELIAYHKMTEIVCDKYRYEDAVAKEDGRVVNYDIIKKFKKSSDCREKIVNEIEKRIEDLN